jgi:hypothetical protein
MMELALSGGTQKEEQPLISTFLLQHRAKFSEGNSKARNEFRRPKQHN